VTGGANAGVATGVAPGTATITAALSGVTSNAATLTVTTGTAVATLSPEVLHFGVQAIDTTSAARTVTLTSTGTGNLAILNIKFAGTDAGDFARTDNCPSSLAPGMNCTINVKYGPTVLGAETASLLISDNAANTPQTVTLTGEGVPQATVFPADLSFLEREAATSLDVKRVTLTNNLPTPLTIDGITFTGADPGNFASPRNTCGTSLAAKSSCEIFVSFTPSGSGSRTATMNINDTANDSPQTVTLTGRGEVRRLR
jgi:hypothetical protein